jgi:hypothetical protein
LRPRAVVPDGDGAALAAAVGLAGVAPELSELALLTAELAEQAVSGAAMAMDAMSSVIVFEILTAKPFF